MPASPSLSEIAQGDPDLRPYVELLEIALAAADDDVWTAAVAPLAQGASAPPRTGEPALHGATIVLPRLQVETLYAWLRDSAGAADLPRQPGTDLMADVLALRPPEGPLGAVLQLTFLPLLMAAGKASAQAVAGAKWTAGICPVCAAWPALAESRGLERTRMLRCGRCGSEWTLPWQLCPFCANEHFASLTYLTSEQAGEARRVFACDRCQGYLKTIATIMPIDPLNVPVEDLATLELDLAAVEAGRRRPAEPGFDLQVELSWG